MQEKEEPKPIEITVPEVKKGTIEFMNKAAFINPTPEKLKRFFEGIRYFCAGLIASVGATDLFTGRQPKIIAFILGVVILATGAAEKAIGVKPAETDK
jgi:hypothetical protein